MSLSKKISGIFFGTVGYLLGLNIIDSAIRVPAGSLILLKTKYRISDSDIAAIVRHIKPKLDQANCKVIILSPDFDLAGAFLVDPDTQIPKGILLPPGWSFAPNMTSYYQENESDDLGG